MKKNILFLIVVFMLSIVVTPVVAQSRKDKKAVKKANWEMEQQHKREEAELLHKMRMDSIVNAKKVAEEKLRAEEEKAKQEAINKAAQEVEVIEPCSDYYTTTEFIRAKGIGEDFDQQFAVDIARSAALNEMASQINTTVQSLFNKHNKSSNKQGKVRSRESISRSEQMIETRVSQETGFRVVCRKVTSFIEDGAKIYKAYVVVEIGTDEILKSLYQDIQKDAELEVDVDYQKFKEEFVNTFPR